MTDRRTPEDTLDVIEESADSDEAERILALSDSALDQELRAEGFDPKAVRARGAALAARLGVEAPAATQAMHHGGEQPPAGDAWVKEPRPVPSRTLGARWAVLLAATLTAALVGGTMYIAGQIGHRDDKPIDLDGSPKGPTKPEQIRARALDACNREQWQECIDALSAARSLDPAGDADPRVQAAWDAAQQALDRERRAHDQTPDKPRRVPPGADRK
jgi:hypothetical protein